MEPTRLLPIIAMLSLVGVEYGGWALLGFLTGRGALGGFREQFFRAGHAHAGVLLVLSPVYFLYLDREQALRHLQELFYSKVLVDPVLQAVFTARRPHHVEHLTWFTAES